MSAVTEQIISPTALASLEELFEFARPGVVRAFLTGHPPVARLLQQARGEISASFGDRICVVLDVMVDPEDDGIGSLCAFIQMPLDADEALSRLDQFNDNWWRTTLGTEAVPLHFVLDYV